MRSLEVESIYAGLTMVEMECIHVDQVQPTFAARTEPGPDYLPTRRHFLMALHGTLLHEHHDFFLASQHPSASPAPRRVMVIWERPMHTYEEGGADFPSQCPLLSHQYTMPARMWKHGIHSFLELLRQCLLKMLDYMLAFISLSYQMMALLDEAVPAFEDTWIECFGELPSIEDLAQLTLAPTHATNRSRKVVRTKNCRTSKALVLIFWCGSKLSAACAKVARLWYIKPAKENPTYARLYHHLGILARTTTTNVSKVATRVGGTFQDCFSIGSMFYLSSLPVALAYPVPPSPSPGSPRLSDETIFDFVMYGVMAIYMLGMWFVREKGTMYSLALMLAMAIVWVATVGDSSSSALCRT